MISLAHCWRKKYNSGDTLTETFSPFPCFPFSLAASLPPAAVESTEWRGEAAQLHIDEKQEQKKAIQVCNCTVVLLYVAHHMCMFLSRQVRGAGEEKKIRKYEVQK